MLLAEARTAVISDETRRRAADARIDPAHSARYLEALDDVTNGDAHELGALFAASYERQLGGAPCEATYRRALVHLFALLCQMPRALARTEIEQHCGVIQYARTT